MAGCYKTIVICEKGFSFETAVVIFLSKSEILLNTKTALRAYHKTHSLRPVRKFQCL